MPRRARPPAAPTTSKGDPSIMLRLPRRALLGSGLLASGLLAGTPARRLLAAEAGALTQPLKIIVPFPAGSVTDTLVRFLLQPLGNALRQTVVIDNRGGGFGVMAMQAAAEAKDGHTVVASSVTTLSLNPVTLPKLPYDPMGDFVHLGLIAETPYVLAVPNASPAKDLPGFVKLAREKAGQLTYAYGNASAQIAAETMARQIGIGLTGIPYRGGAEALTDIVAGRVDCTFTDITNGLAQARQGAMRALAVTTAQETPLAPGLPPLASVLPDFALTVWFGLSAPKSLPPERAAYLNRTLNHVLAQPEMQRILFEQGYTTRPMSGPDYTAFVAEETGRWGRLAREAGLAKG